MNMTRPEVSYRILEECQVGEQRLVIYDYTAFPPDKPARNLFAYGPTGEMLWRAESIDRGATDAYGSFFSTTPLKVWNFCCCVCTIDVKTGQITQVEESR
ncbi:hypothetical protein [Hymenobacter metallilatus]|uniref:Uncharacterized protein n=1 Tax=Hymenobacter metallilatus TaxID=2493666 RepID=A0A428IXW7_9BACT|nr:hypothetical protein [Hymenobacter metallilatus]RSK23872.1 hypothetical protein EI290_21855 [Hymenobacter metallilatus]